MSIIRNRLYQFKQELLSNKDRAWYSHTNLLTAVDLLMLHINSWHSLSPRQAGRTAVL